MPGFWSDWVSYFGFSIDFLSYSLDLSDSSLKTLFSIVDGFFIEGWLGLGLVSDGFGASACSGKARPAAFLSGAFGLEGKLI